MRLINTSTWQLESFAHMQKPPDYAIFSHTWEGEEVLFEDIRQLDDDRWRRKRGFRKLENFISQAATDDFEYAWIDTCCIDKSSSAELSEAINSMYRWYERAAVCYAFLADAKHGQPLDRCRWFTRGWTLQELIAPKEVIFLDKAWTLLGTKGTMAVELSRITSIDLPLLRDSVGRDAHSGSKLDAYPAATKFAWASRRITTRAEDEAYCLLGLFGINMPLLYGEGPHAFRRLQEAIIRATGDTSVMAFNSSFVLGHQPLAKSVKSFQLKLQGVTKTGGQRSVLHLEGSRLELHVQLCPATASLTTSETSLRFSEDTEEALYYYALFECCLPGYPLAPLAMVVQKKQTSQGPRYQRLRRYGLVFLDPQGESLIPRKITGPVRGPPSTWIAWGTIARTDMTQWETIILDDETRDREYWVVQPSLHLELGELAMNAHGYRFEYSDLPMDNDVMTPQPVTDRVDRYGLHKERRYEKPRSGCFTLSNSKQRVLVAWGCKFQPEPEPPVPWCKAVVLDAARSASLKVHPGHSLEQRPDAYVVTNLHTWVSEDRLFQQLNWDERSEWEEPGRCPAIWLSMRDGSAAHYIVVKMKAETFLGRTLFHMDIGVQRLRPDTMSRPLHTPRSKFQFKCFCLSLSVNQN